MTIEIDSNSGFCFGVVTAINKAEEELSKSDRLQCLGAIVHNSMEVRRLEEKGLITIGRDEFDHLRGQKILFRAHGEPPSTYHEAEKNGLTIIDATCPVVLNLQKRIRRAYLESDRSKTQVVIYGKKAHAEVNGLVGQTDGHAIVIEGLDDLSKLDYSKNIRLFSQTTKSIERFNRIVEEIKKRMISPALFEFNDTICRQVANRIPKIINFVARHDLILFVSGKESSNGRVLYDECKKVNSNIYMISDLEEVDYTIFEGVKTVGICGATSTPKWLMEELKQKIEQNI